MKLTQNTIVITGGTSGIGLAFAKAFLERDNQVIILGRRKERLNKIKQEHPKIITRQMDVTRLKERTGLIEWISENVPETNVFINNAGIQRAINLKEPGDLSNIQAEIDTNLVAPIHLCTLFSSYFLKKKRSTIVNISSGLAFTPLAEKAVYCATKAAIHSFTLSLRYQLKDTNIGVFEIAPPGVDTELGHQDRMEANDSHGGMPVAEFVDKALKALENDNYETAIGVAKKLRENRENFMDQLNN